MCARYTLHRPVPDISAAFEALPVEDLKLDRHYNVAPTDQVAMVARMEGERRLMPVRWGLVPFFMKGKKGPPLINARVETAASQPAFRQAWRNDRFCVVPADGFFEWKKDGKLRLPSLFSRKDGKLLALAGLWESYRDDDGRPVYTCTILTGVPNGLVAGVHDRMAVVLDDADVGPWLAGDARRDPEAWTARLLNPFPAERMIATPVSTHVNSVKHDDPECIAPLG